MCVAFTEKVKKENGGHLLKHFHFYCIESFLLRICLYDSADVLLSLFRIVCTSFVWLVMLLHICDSAKGEILAFLIPSLHRSIDRVCVCIM